MKKIALIFLAVALLANIFCSCGKMYTCKNCDKSVSKAYYDMDANIERVMCEDCAREYWMPLDYRTYRVK